MRKWGGVISAFYALILLVLLLPVFVLLAQSQYHGLPQFLRDLAEAYRAWETWVVFAVLFSGQALLLFLSVDTTQRRLQPRAHFSNLPGGIHPDRRAYLRGGRRHRYGGSRG